MQKRAIQAKAGKKSFPVVVADTFLKRFVGLMGRRETDYGLLLIPCNAVHTCFMRYELDLLFLDGDNRVLKVMRKVKPWRMTGAVRGARAVIEFPSSLGVPAEIEKGSGIILNTEG